MTKHDALELLRLMRMDLTQLQARLTTIKVAVANSDWTDTPADNFVCTRCGVSKRTREKLGDHLVDVHGVDRAFVASVVAAHNEREAA